MKSKLVIYVEREDGKRISITNEIWFAYETKAYEMLKLVLQYAIKESLKQI